MMKQILITGLVLVILGSVLWALSLIDPFLFFIFSFGSQIVVAILVLSFAMYLFFYLVIPGSSYLVSKLCIYHKLKCRQEGTGETIQTKIKLVFVYNSILTIPMILTILYILSIFNSQTSKLNDNGALPDFDIALIFALSIVPGLLVTLRILANPTHYGIYIIKREYYGTLSDIKKRKDDISSFYSTLIVGTILYLILQYCVDYFHSHSYLSFFGRFIPSMPWWAVIIFILAYLLALFIVSSIGELILAECIPIDQEHYYSVES